MDPLASTETVGIIVTDLSPHHGAWMTALRFAEAMGTPCSRILGFTPRVRLGSLSLDNPANDDAEGALARVIREETERGADAILLLPGILDLGLFQRQALAEIASSARKRHKNLSIHYDDVDIGHPLLIRGFADQIQRSMPADVVDPARLGLLVAASGHGEAASRAQSYRLMRLLWEELSFAEGDVAFLRHPKPFLPLTLGRCLTGGLIWVVVPQVWWGGEHAECARTIFAEYVKTNEQARNWRFVDPLGEHPCLSAWLQQRLLKLWDGRRRRTIEVLSSAKRQSCPRANVLHGPRARCPLDEIPREINRDLRYGDGLIAEVHDSTGLAHAMELLNPGAAPVFVKVTWHGYAPGTYTDPVALNRLLDVFPKRSVLLEGHTSSRNLGGSDWDWETEARSHRAWIRDQELEYLRRTGLADVLSAHDAQYLNVTEAWWNGACAPKGEIEQILADAGVSLKNPELTAFVPQVLLEHRGATLVSVARFKGTTRSSLSNLFGLIPPPLRTAWHGPNITYFAQVCCDLAKLYGCLFRLVGMVEGLHVAVRWNRRGLYRSRWGNYDLIPQPNLVTASDGLVAADVLACRLQGGDPRNSAFFDIVDRELGLPREAVSEPVPPHLIRRLA